jgi:protein-tyrosine phosphatase
VIAEETRTVASELTQAAINAGIFPVTDRILLGRFLTPDRAKLLPGLSVTHVLNVSDAPSVVSAADAGVREIVDLPIEDLRQLPVEAIEDALVAIHRILHENEGTVLVHCTACQNRSPTIVWLYLIASGMEPDQAAAMITSVVRDAVPGHSSLVSSELVEWARRLGDKLFDQ